MVCTGDTLIFGIQMELSDAVKYILKYLKANTSNSTYDDFKEYFADESNDRYEIFDQLESIFKQAKLSIDIIKAPCCLFPDDTGGDFAQVYLGVELCSNSLVSRFDPKEFNTIEDYEKFYVSGLVKAKAKLQENKTKYIEDISKFVPKKKANPKLYTIPNDCFNCS